VKSEPQNANTVGPETEAQERKTTDVIVDLTRRSQKRGQYVELGRRYAILQVASLMRVDGNF